MSSYRLEIRIIPRQGLLDPAGKAIHHALQSLEYDTVSDVRVGKAIYVDLEADSPESAIALTEDMCHKLLANPVTEDFNVRIADEVEAPA